MPYLTDTELDLTPKTLKKYFVSSAHRRYQKDKSRWTISIDNEIECFVNSQTSNWIEDLVSWGVFQQGNNLLNIGVNPQRLPLKIAKFVDCSGDDIWHGYPADYARNYQDRPGMLVLQNWRERGIIEKHHIIKIRQGKECNL